MYAVKNTDTGKFYTGKKDPAARWGQHGEARWVQCKATAKSIIGGLKNDKAIPPGALRIVTIND